MIELDSKDVKYSEYSNDTLIATFKLNNQETAILSYSEKEVTDINNLCKLLPNLDQNEIVATLHTLEVKGILYCSENFEEIVSLIILPSR